MKKRINVTLDSQLDEMLSAFSNRYGITKSGLVSFIVGQWLDQMERLNQTVYGSNDNQGLLQKAFEQLSIDDIEK